MWNEINVVKKDLFEKTYNSNEKFHNWINLHRDKILPNDITDSIEFDINNEPQKYIKCMIYMNTELEKLDKTQFQVLPLRTDFNIKHIYTIYYSYYL